jgi:hypothetical protein
MYKYIQPIVQPVGQHAVSCIQTSNRLTNRLANRLHRANAASKARATTTDDESKLHVGLMGFGEYLCQKGSERFDLKGITMIYRIIRVVFSVRLPETNKSETEITHIDASRDVTVFKPIHPEATPMNKIRHLLIIRFVNVYSSQIIQLSLSARMQSSL